MNNDNLKFHSLRGSPNDRCCGINQSMVDRVSQHYCQPSGCSLIWEFPSIVVRLIAILSVIIKHSVKRVIYNGLECIGSRLNFGVL